MADDSMMTKIYFSAGEPLHVLELAGDVENALNACKRESRFAKLTKQGGGGGAVYVAADQVAYLVAVPEPSTGAPSTKRRLSKHKQQSA